MLLIRASSFALRSGIFGYVYGEPWIGLMARRSAPALEHFQSWMDLLLDELCFTCPAPVQVTQAVALTGRHVPDAGLRALERDGLRSLVMDDCVLLDHTGAAIDAVMQAGDQIVLDVFGDYVERVAMNLVADVT